MHPAFPRRRLPRSKACTSPSPLTPPLPSPPPSSVFTNEFWHNVVEEKWDSYIELNIVSLIAGDFAAGAALITFGALLGKTTPMQMLFIVFFEMIFYSLNESIGVVKFEACVGGECRIRFAPCATRCS